MSEFGNVIFARFYDSQGSPQPPTSKPEHVVTEAEEKVLDHLVSAWHAFLALERAIPGHPNDKDEFSRSISQCQMLISHRVAVRVDPQTWSNT